MSLFIFKTHNNKKVIKKNRLHNSPLVLKKLVLRKWKKEMLLLIIPEEIHNHT